MITSRKARPLDRVEAVRDARLIVIATEGERSEPIYFDIFHSTRVKLAVIPCVDGRSSPAATLERLKEYTEEYDLDGDDELWLVIDRDRWTDEMIAAVARQCVASRFNLALSNPSFEIWLALHYVPSIPDTIRSNDAEKFFRDLHGSYNKGRYDPFPLKNLVREAIQNACRLDEPKGQRWPSSTGSHVYLLAQSILSASGSEV